MEKVAKSPRGGGSGGGKGRRSNKSGRRFSAHNASQVERWNGPASPQRGTWQTARRGGGGAFAWPPGAWLCMAPCPLNWPLLAAVSPPPSVEHGVVRYRQISVSEVFSSHVPSPPMSERSDCAAAESDERPRASFRSSASAERQSDMVTPRLWALASVDQNNHLSKQVLSRYLHYRQPLSLFERKLKLREKLYEAIKATFNFCGMYVVGSSMNGFGSDMSDMDICVMVSQRPLIQKTEGYNLLLQISKILNKQSWVAARHLIYAKVPILRVNFSEPFDDIQVDLNANNAVAIRNTHLLFYYALFDPRVRPLNYVLKEWARRQGINDASRSTLSSYALTLMLINYLQVLPSLQLSYPHRFGHMTDVRNLRIDEALEPPPAELFTFDNSKSTADLLLGFLAYYGQSFDFDREAVSVRLGATISRGKMDKPWAWQWRCLFIEEPFSQTNAAYAVYEPALFESIKRVFRRSFDELQGSRDLLTILAGGPFSNLRAAVGESATYLSVRPTNSASVESDELPADEASATRRGSVNNERASDSGFSYDDEPLDDSASKR